MLTWPLTNHRFWFFRSNANRPTTLCFFEHFGVSISENIRTNQGIIVTYRKFLGNPRATSQIEVYSQ